MGKSNLLNEIFDVDRIKIMTINKKEQLFLIILLIIIIFLLIIKKDYYYTNIAINVGDSVSLIADKEMISKIHNYNKVIINNNDYEYSINEIQLLDDIYLVNINLGIRIDTFNNIYKIYLGKETVLEYIFRILKKI